MQEISYKDLKFNPFNLIGGEWMLIAAGNKQKCNTMTASWGHLGCLWGHNDPTAVIYLHQKMVFGICSLTIVLFKRRSNEETKNQVFCNNLPLLVCTFGLAGGWSLEIPDDS